MTSATLSCFGRCVVGFARRTKERTRVHILEHLAHQKSTEKHEKADNNRGHHGVSLSLVQYERPRVVAESGDKIFKLQRISIRPWSRWRGRLRASARAGNVVA